MFIMKGELFLNMMYKILLLEDDIWREDKLVDDSNEAFKLFQQAVENSETYVKLVKYESELNIYKFIAFGGDLSDKDLSIHRNISLEECYLIEEVVGVHEHRTPITKIKGLGSARLKFFNDFVHKFPDRMFQLTAISRVFYDASRLLMDSRLLPPKSPGEHKDGQNQQASRQAEGG
jgi:hypothetical protein